MYTAYSFVPLAVLQELQETGKIIPRPVYYKGMGEDDYQFQRAYQWLHRQMLARGIASLGDRSGMFWMYVKTPYGLGKPDMRYRLYKRFVDNGNMALLTLRIPKERVLVSDYDGWHWVLNNWYLHDDTVEDFDQTHDWLDLVRTVNHKKLQRLREQSWLHIFDQSTIAKKMGIVPEQVTWQGTAFDICGSDVVDIKVYRDGKLVQQ